MNKKNNKRNYNQKEMRKLRLLFLLVILMGCTKSFAANFYDFAVNGIAYKITSNSAPYTVEVTFNDVTKEMYAKPTYIGNITIPTIVAYGGNSYSVTSIGNNAFNGCSGLKSVTIPNSVTSIGNEAFNGCSGLTSMSVSDNVKSIGYGAFSNCSGLTFVTIPNSVMTIGESAFYGCSGLKIVNVTDLVAWCNINFACDNSNPLKYAHHLWLNGSEIIHMVIPDGIKHIRNYAFQGLSAMKSVTIPNSVMDIDDCAFQYCSGLDNVIIPDSVKFIGEWAFCGCSGLIGVMIGKSVESIAFKAFEACGSLTAVYITDLAAWCGIKFSVHSGNPLQYAQHLYLNGTEIKDLVIPDSVTSIGNLAFSGCCGLTSVNIPSSVLHIGSKAFSCNDLTSVTIPGIFKLADVFPYDTEISSLFISNGSSSICDLAFKDCKGILSVAIPNSVTSIGNEAFSGCSSLKSVDMGNGIISIGTNAFKNCSGLLSVTIPNSVTSIGSEAFSGCRGLTSMNIPNEVAIIEEGVFKDCSRLMLVTVPNSVEYIGNCAFEGCSGLMSVTIPNSVTSIGRSAFWKCSSLKSVIIPSSIISIGMWAFYGCNGLMSVTIPKSVTSIGNCAFQACYSLNAVNIMDLASWFNVEFDDALSNPLYYAHRIYLNGAEINDLVIPSSVVSIGNYAFYNCSGLTSISIPSSVEFIGDDSFYGCSGLNLVSMTDLATWCHFQFNRYDSNPLYYAKHLYLNGYEVMNLEIPKNVMSIYQYAFSGCSGLKSVTIPNSVINIGVGSFSGCSGLLDITSGITTLFAFDKNVFDTDAYNNATVHVPSGMKGEYTAHASWGLFNKITEVPLSINSITADPKNAEGCIYDMQGREVLNPERGHIYIKDGKKILIQ